jgi:hypothetical protein
MGASCGETTVGRQCVIAVEVYSTPIASVSTSRAEIHYQTTQDLTRHFAPDGTAFDQLVSEDWTTRSDTVQSLHLFATIINHVHVKRKLS